MLRGADDAVAGFVRWLDAHDHDRPTLIGYEKPSVGFSSQTLLVDVARSGAGRPREERLVLKLPPVDEGIFPTYDFALQARVQEAVSAAGVPAPVPARAESDASWAGAPFLVMPAIEGHIIDEMPVRDRWLTRADPDLNTTVHHRYLDVIADIHRIDWSAHGLDTVVPVRDNAAEIAYWRDYLAWYADGEVVVPSLVEALDWCDANRPATEPASALLWGDVRLGNIIFDESRSPVAVLDWEMATIGAPEHDLAWTLTLEATLEELVGRTVPGFLGRDAALARYEARVGRAVGSMDWYEIFALVRSTAVMTRVTRLSVQAGTPAFFPLDENPILDILSRRIAAADVRSG